jgi:integrase
VAVAKALTDIAIQNLKPRAVRYEVPDAGARGLRVIVQPSGVRSFAVRYRNAAGRARKLTLPGGITLAAARKLAADAMLEVAQGHDPGGAKQAARDGARSRVDDTVERLGAQFLDQHARRKTRENSWRATEGIFRNIVLPAWGRRTVHEIRRRDVIDLLEDIATDRPIMANRVKAALSRYFRWLADRDVLAASPCVGITAPARETPRDRVLSDEELRRLWCAAEALGGAAGACIKLLVLTGQRRSEIAGLRRTEVDGDVLVLPAERMKGRVSHVVPLSTQAVALIAALPRTGKYVFGTAAVGHFDRIKRELDSQMGPMPKWVTHDIRRTVASGMARIGIAVPVIEKLLAHRGGSFRGVAGTYQRHSFLPEMAIAVQRWADHVEQLVTGKSAKVVKLRRH